MTDEAGLQVQPMADLLAVGGLVREAMALGDLLKAQEDNLLTPDHLTASQRGVLVTLRKEGPLTLAALARSRGFSRQNARVLVNPLVKRGYLKQTVNPAHKRAYLVEISVQGLTTLQGVLHREGEILTRLAAEIPGLKAKEATRVLKDLARILRAGDQS